MATRPPRPGLQSLKRALPAPRPGRAAEPEERGPARGPLTQGLLSARGTKAALSGPHAGRHVFLKHQPVGQMKAKIWAARPGPGAAAEAPLISPVL